MALTRRKRKAALCRVKLDAYLRIQNSAARELFEFPSQPRMRGSQIGLGILWPEVGLGFLH